MPNRLVDAASPYLRQHADNPVDWWPWSDAAFEEAARRDVPVFLSIGYATCHWCHVMAHRSFEDAAVAEALNRAFVCVKLDREERPDVDAVYMAACQMVTGHGGWPLTVVTTPDRRPFFVGTYLPARREHGRPGVVDLAAAMSEAWRTRRADVLAAAGDMTAMLDARFAPPPEDAAAAPALGRHTLDAAVATLRARFDAEHGGFGRAPRFPSPHVLAFLMRRHRHTGEADLLAMVETTLDAMQRSGIHDRVGGGFHRYATDRAWRLPHFEKMLYDQAGLLGVYAEAAALTGRVDFAETATGIVGYVERDLRLRLDLFASAEDADSLAADGPHAGHMHEGAFYTWTPSQLVEALGEEDGLFVARLFGVTEAGNIWDEATGAATGESLLVTTAPVRDLAPANADPDTFARRIDGLLDRLRAARDARPRPLRDDKALADWNGWFAANALRAASLPSATWVGAIGGDGIEGSEARDAALSHLAAVDARFEDGGRLAHRLVDGHDSLAAIADDYAFLASAHLAALTWQPLPSLQRAIDLADRLIADHWDEARGLFTTARRGTSDLIASPAERYDGAMPSANSVAVDVLQRLARLTGRDDYACIARRMWEAAAAEIAAYPSGFCHALLALDDAVEGTREIVVAVRGDAGGHHLLDAARDLAGPDDLVLRITDADRALLADIAPPLAAYAPPPDGHEAVAWAYVCQNFHCEAPVETVEALRALLSDS